MGRDTDQKRGLCEHVNEHTCCLKAGTFVAGSMTVKIPWRTLHSEVSYLVITDKD
jgi:hypothetical protein